MLLTRWLCFCSLSELYRSLPITEISLGKQKPFLTSVGLGPSHMFSDRLPDYPPLSISIYFIYLFILSWQLQISFFLFFLRAYFALTAISSDKVFAKKQMVILFSVLWKDIASQFSKQCETLVEFSAFRRINQALENRNNQFPLITTATAICFYKMADLHLNWPLLQYQ